MSDNTEITMREADKKMAARFISESDGDFPELSALFARHAAQARLEAIEEAAKIVDERAEACRMAGVCGGIDPIEAQILDEHLSEAATAIRSLSTRGDQK